MNIIDFAMVFTVDLLPCLLHILRGNSGEWKYNGTSERIFIK